MADYEDLAKRAYIRELGDDEIRLLARDSEGLSMEDHERRRELADIRPRFRNGEAAEYARAELSVRSEQVEEQSRLVYGGLIGAVLLVLLFLSGGDRGDDDVDEDAIEDLEWKGR